ncbi:cobalamin B12-binding domain-containing protein [Micromonospora mirobrigensis]|uniref:Methanogenic corrinoid protein MtbC1 n=1 Tax=Micromonospora mirobrigensis TaxID=262898 RepID=A0A1C4XKB5_9ACTN|nr:cobalamin-dependent protein [Micromonospora mirobrigensis]SCF08969.1 Methanogenic corrinoid protein MtbC1 [Micromonospora mirobrigensis]
MTPAGAGGGVDTAAVRAYLDCLDRADQTAAVRLATDLLDAGASVADVLVDVVAAAQQEIGRRWFTGRWSVAQEHAATHISELVAAAVAARTPAPTGRGRIVVACVEGEWHALPARIVAEVLRADGWQVTFLGASVPARHLVSYLHQTGPDAVLLSCLLSTRLVRAGRMVEACRAAGVPVLAGGPGFGTDGRWAAPLGAAGWGASARDAARLLRRPLRPAGPFPAAADDEYVAVLRHRRTIVQHALNAVDPAEDEADEVAAVVGQLVDALAAAIRVGDPALLAGFVGWQSEVSRVRPDGTPLLDVLLDVCAAALAEHPRAGDHLRRARRTAVAG